MIWVSRMGSSLFRCPPHSLVMLLTLPLSCYVRNDVRPGGPGLCHCLLSIVPATWGYGQIFAEPCTALLDGAPSISGHLNTDFEWNRGHWVISFSSKKVKCYFIYLLKVSRYSQSQAEGWGEADEKLSNQRRGMLMLTADSLGGGGNNCVMMMFALAFLRSRVAVCIIAPALMIHRQFPAG